jgi:hypothetical protein
MNDLLSTHSKWDTGRATVLGKNRESAIGTLVRKNHSLFNGVPLKERLKLLLEGLLKNLRASY